MSELTPVMKQYQGVKEKHGDSIVLFRLGDFYEMFGEDAKVASRLLGIALTTRDKGKEDPLPMCGIPHFAADSYIAKLIKAGHKVAVCEQTEEPGQGKGIVEREVVRVITPGTHTPSEPKENNFIMSFFPGGRRHGIAVADVSTGQFFLYETEKPLEDELRRYEPKEVLLPESLKADIHYKAVIKDCYTTMLGDLSFDYTEALRRLLRHFKVATLEGFGCEGMESAVSAAGALVTYIEETERGGLSFTRLIPRTESSYMFLDAPAQRNLELVRNLRDGGLEGSLLWALDETLTPMGGRFLRSAILQPLIDVGGIRRRLDAVACLVEDYELSEALRKGLRNIQDIERLERRISSGTANARDLIALKSSLAALPMIKEALVKSGDDYLRALGGGMAEFSGLISLIQNGLQEHPPLGLRDGGIIKDGFDKDVDELRALSKSGKGFISALEAEERKKTGISSLKVGYNKVFGYYIEITKPNLSLVPDRYIRKQTLTTGERFLTEELKAYESKVIGAEEKLKALEYEVFSGIRDKVKERSSDLQETSGRIAALDFLLSLSVAGKRHNYVKPHVDGGAAIKIVEGRHPVLERIPSHEKFIPNSVYIDGRGPGLLVITGPNMAGKSTYMRQVALIILMAQIGSFVPAEEAEIGVADRIFTRIGASDFLQRGQSTFMVEMVETANILNNATGRSLILLDEIGRGTSTFDGISIAWAAAEYIVRTVKARTLFATHYNELTELALTLDAVKNCNVSVKEWGDEIIFLRKIEEGAADRSYGIQVARLAGIPEPVIKRAKDVLGNLERTEFTASGGPRPSPVPRPRRRQLDLFASRAEDEALSLLRSVELESLGPEEALKILRELLDRITQDKKTNLC